MTVIDCPNCGEHTFYHINATFGKGPDSQERWVCRNPACEWKEPA